MGELIDYFSKRFKKNNSESGEQYMLSVVKNAIDSSCSKNLKNVGDTFIFEVIPKDLSYAVTVIDEEPLCSKYNIVQIDKTVFSATLRELDF